MMKVMILAAVMAAAGCGGDSDDEVPPPPPASTRVSCTASINALHATYAIGDGGRMVTLNDGLADEVTFERLSAPSDQLVGTWLIGDQVTNGVTLHVEFVVGTNTASVTGTCSAQGKVAHATATSPATITDTTLDILTSDTDTQFSN